MALSGIPKGMNGKRLPMVQRLVRSPVVKLAVQSIQNGLTHKQMMLAGRGLDQQDTEWFVAQLKKVSIENIPFAEEVDEVFNGSMGTLSDRIDQFYADKGLLQCPIEGNTLKKREERVNGCSVPFGIATLLFAVGAVLSGTLGEHYGFLRVPQLDRQVLEYCDPTMMAAACRNRYQICPDSNQSQGSVDDSTPEDDALLDPSNPLLKDCIRKEHWIYQMHRVVVAFFIVFLALAVVCTIATVFACVFV